MSATWFPGITPSREVPVEIDTSVAHPARIYDYILGGKNNFAADQAAARAALAANPAVATAMLENRAVMRRMTAFLAGEAGIAYQRAGITFQYRTREEFARFFTGLELVPPGIVPMAEWRAQSEPDPRPAPAEASAYAAVARKN
jgi:S-adenosyl methyltransferase